MTSRGHNPAVAVRTSAPTAEIRLPDVLVVVADENLNPTRVDPAEPVPEERARAELIARLFREHNDALVQFLTARLRSPHEAREVAQEAYVRVLSLHVPGAVSFLRAFLFKTASNLAIDRIRHRQRCPHSSDVSLFDELLETRTPETRAESAEAVALLAKMLTELTPKCREAFLLHKIDGLGAREIGERMHLSERQVRDYILRALLHCRAGLIRAGVLREDTR